MIGFLTGKSQNLSPQRPESRLQPLKTPSLERVKGIEPSSSAWKAVALPLSYTRRITVANLKTCRNTSASGECRIRTYEGVSHQIYSLTPLAAWVTPLVRSAMARVAPGLHLHVLSLGCDAANYPILQPPGSKSRTLRPAGPAVGIEPATYGLQNRCSAS